MIFFAMTACTSKVAVKTARTTKELPEPLPSTPSNTDQKPAAATTDPAAAATPAEPAASAEVVAVDQGLDADRLFAQSRTALLFVAKPSFATNEQQLALANETTGAVLTESWLASTPLKFNALPLLSAHQLVYGPNRLRATTTDADEPRSAASTLTIKDFSLVTAHAGGFAAGEGQRLSGLELQVGGPSKPWVTNGSNILTVGKVGIYSK